MKIVAHIEVKFRAFGVTFGTVKRDYEKSLVGIPMPLNPQNLLMVNDRGVILTVSLAA